jgi:hypothetical protein
MVARIIHFLVSYPSAHWHGHHAIALTLLVTVVGLRCLTAVLLPFLPEAAGLAAIGAWIAANVVVLVWQLGGAWRASERHLALPPDMLAAVGGYFTMLVATVLAVIQTVDGVSRLGPRPTLPPGIEAAGSAMILPVGTDGRSVRISGDLSYEVNTALEAALAQHAGIATVELDSSGGQIFAARAIARTIARHRLDTYVSHRCYSACTLTFMAGQRRGLGQDGQLGFHQYAIPGDMRVKIIDIAAEQAKDRDYFASRGVTEAFLRRIFQVRHQQIWVPGRDALKNGRVITDQ